MSYEKSTAAVHLCSRKKIHRSEAAASEAAWRHLDRKRLKTAELEQELREVLAKARKGASS